MDKKYLIILIFLIPYFVFGETFLPNYAIWYPTTPEFPYLNKYIKIKDFYGTEYYLENVENFDKKTFFVVSWGSCAGRYWSTTTNSTWWDDWPSKYKQVATNTFEEMNETIKSFHYLPIKKNINIKNFYIGFNSSYTSFGYCGYDEIFPNYAFSENNENEIPLTSLFPQNYESLTQNYYSYIFKLNVYDKNKNLKRSINLNHYFLFDTNLNPYGIFLEIPEENEQNFYPGDFLKLLIYHNNNVYRLQLIGLSLDANIPRYLEEWLHMIYSITPYFFRITNVVENQTIDIEQTCNNNFQFQASWFFPSSENSVYNFYLFIRDESGEILNATNTFYSSYQLPSEGEGYLDGLFDFICQYKDSLGLMDNILYTLEFIIYYYPNEEERRLMSYELSVKFFNTGKYYSPFTGIYDFYNRYKKGFLLDEYATPTMVYLSIANFTKKIFSFPKYNVSGLQLGKEYAKKLGEYLGKLSNLPFFSLSYLKIFITFIILFIILSFLKKIFLR